MPDASSEPQQQTARNFSVFSSIISDEPQFWRKYLEVFFTQPLYCLGKQSGKELNVPFIPGNSKREVSLSDPHYYFQVYTTPELAQSALERMNGVIHSYGVLEKPGYILTAIALSAKSAEVDIVLHYGAEDFLILETKTLQALAGSFEQGQSELAERDLEYLELGDTCIRKLRALIGSEKRIKSSAICAFKGEQEGLVVFFIGADQSTEVSLLFQPVKEILAKGEVSFSIVRFVALEKPGETDLRLFNKICRLGIRLV